VQRRHSRCGRFLWLRFCALRSSHKGRAQPSAETVARGKSLTVPGDCAVAITRDPAKPFAGQRSTRRLAASIRPI